MTDTNVKKTGFPSKDKPWMKYYPEAAAHIEPKDQSMYEMLVESAQQGLDDVALEYFQWTCTYGEMIKDIDHIAAGFTSLGVKPGDIVTLAIPNIPENVLAIYALNKIGAVSNLIDLRLSGEELVRYINEVRSKVVVACDLFLENLMEVLPGTTAETVIVCSPFDHFPAPLKFVLQKKAHVKVPKSLPSVITWKEFQSRLYAPVETYHVASTMWDTACILHTSGTTGASKGVMLSNTAFNVLPLEYRHLYGTGHFKPNTKIMNQVPPFLAYNVSLCTHNPLVNHLRLDLLPDYQPEKYAENILKHKPQHVTAGPADWENFLNNPKLKGKDFSFLETIASGSDSLRYEMRKEIDDILTSHGSPCTIIEGYGMTEVGCAATTNHYGIDVPGSVGVPYPTLTVCIYDNENDCELPYGEKGEICITGDRLMNGYFERPEDSAAVLKKHADGKVWMHSGDLGYMNEDGFLFLDGRLKRIIIQHNGMKVNPFEIENVILNAPEVQACCVVGMPDEEHGRGQVPAAYYVANTGNPMSEEIMKAEIRKLCEENLAERYMPAKIEALDALPITPNGKVDYRSLERKAADEA